MRPSERSPATAVVVTRTIAALAAPALLALASPAPAAREAAHEPAHEALDKAVALKFADLRARGVRTAAVERRALPDILRAPAEIRFNESRRVVVTARTGGWIERIAVFANQRVARGELLAELYSPEFLSAQQAFLLIRARRERGGSDPSDADTAALLADAEQRLRILGLSEEEIRRLADSRRPYRHLHVHSPIAGTVIERRLNAGDTVEPGQALYVVADLGTVWAEIALTEAQLGRVRPGQPVTLTVQAYPEHRFEGTLLSVGARLDEATRTVKARALIENRARRLKPGMFAQAQITVGGGRPVVAVPAAAVTLFKGRPSVFKVDGGRLQVQRVEPGATRGGWTEIARGLGPGEEIVVQGVFLVKSLLLKSEMGEGHVH